MILQFGTGNFLRAFVDLFVEEQDRESSHRIGPVVAIQSTGRERADLINASGSLYHVAIQGVRNGKTVDQTERVTSLQEALHAESRWMDIRSRALDPDLVAIVSNTTEAGLSLDPRDVRRSDSVPHSFPAKLLDLLLHRAEAGLPGPWILPCELVENNADRLLELVLDQAALWSTDSDFVADTLSNAQWTNTLVDRIVPGRPRNHPLLESDPLLVSAEPFAMWAVETEDETFPFTGHPSVILAEDISSYTLRKVRILNGAHSALVARSAGTGVKTVRECAEHPEIGPWLEGLLTEEIVPVLKGRCEDPAKFARETLDRFRNPFLEHELAAIALHHETKLEVRLRPTLDEFCERFGKHPPRLAEILPGID